MGTARDKSFLGNGILMSVDNRGGCMQGLQGNPFGNHGLYLQRSSPFPSGTEPVAQDLIYTFAQSSLQTSDFGGND